MKNKAGFTLVEVLVTTVILAIVAVAVLYAMAQCLNLQETAKNLTIAMSAARAEIERLRNQDFTSIIPGTFTFDPYGLNGSGQINITPVDDLDDPDLLNVRAVVCWQQGNRIIGEDNGRGGGTALDGQVNGSEDVNNNTLLDSTCVVTSSLGDRGYD